MMSRYEQKPTTPEWAFVIECRAQGRFKEAAEAEKRAREYDRRRGSTEAVYLHYCDPRSETKRLTSTENPYT